MSHGSKPAALFNTTADATLRRIRQLSAELERASRNHPQHIVRYRALVVQIAVEAGAYVKLLDAAKGLHKAPQPETVSRHRRRRSAPRKI